VDILDTIIGADDRILVTGAAGFIGSRVVASLLQHGLRKVRCFVRPFRDLKRLEDGIQACRGDAEIEFLRGNLLDRDDCLKATENVAVIYHLAAGTGEKSFPDAFANSVVATRNLLAASTQNGGLRRFVSMSSFAVYTNRQKPHGRLLDESCPIEEQPHLRGEAYCYAKTRQDQLVMEYSRQHGIPYVLLRPGVVYGPGKNAITGRVGLGTFGLFLHLGGTNPIPLTYVENCAEAIVLAGLKPGAENQVFNVVDDDLPSSRQFLREYKKNVRPFKSIYLPHIASYLLCWSWEKYSRWSRGQLPPVYNRRTWHAYWKRTKYTNEKLKRLLGWTPEVRTAEGLRQFFASCRAENNHA
jgi:nucleoside-diphosphate-sugar epimerase